MIQFSRLRPPRHEAQNDWRREYARKMRDTAARQGRVYTYSGGRAAGKTKALQSQVDEARAAGQEVWVHKRIDGRSLVEKVPGIWIDPDAKGRPIAEQLDDGPWRKCTTIHIPREVLESWQETNR